MGKEEAGDSHAIIIEWGGAWVVPRPGDGSGVVPETGMGSIHTHTILSHIFSMSPKLSLTLPCLKFNV
jgi:hypothetical protein